MRSWPRTSRTTAACCPRRELKSKTFLRSRPLEDRVSGRGSPLPGAQVLQRIGPVAEAGDEAVVSEMPDMDLVDLLGPEPRLPDRDVDIDQDHHGRALFQDRLGIEALELAVLQTGKEYGGDSTALSRLVPDTLGRARNVIPFPVRQ